MANEDQLQRSYEILNEGKNKNKNKSKDKNKNKKSEENTELFITKKGWGSSQTPNIRIETQQVSSSSSGL